MGKSTTDIISYPVSMDTPDLLFCKFNSGINCCDKSKCHKCGWNPEVSELRAWKARKTLDTYGKIPARKKETP